MKQIIFTLILLGFICINTQAQDKNIQIKNILDECQCNIPNGVEYNLSTIREEAKKTFYDLDKVTSIIDRVADLPNKANIETIIKEGLLNKNGRDSTWDIVKTTLLSELKEVSNNNRSAEAICLITKHLHGYYLDRLSDDLLKDTRYAQSYTPSQNANQPIVTTDSVNSNTVNETKGDIIVNSVSFGYSMILIIISILLLIFSIVLLIINASLKKKLKLVNNNRPEPRNSSSLEKSQKQEISILKNKIESLEYTITDKNSKIEELNLSIASISSSSTKEEPTTISSEIKSNNEFIKNSSSNSRIDIYLQTPTPEGVFYKNGITDLETSESFYRINLDSKDSQNGTLHLITTEEKLNRAEAMAQEYLISGCELQGKGKINYATLKIIPGKVQKDGSGWRIVEKIKLRW